MNIGKLIVIEGLDGSGKATQAEKLYQALRSQNINTIKISFPDYESDSSALIKMYLRGDFGDSPDSVNAYAASSFYAVDRYASFKKDWEEKYNEGFVIIADRYTTSNMIHQCSKLPQLEWEKFNQWLIDYEYRMLGIPEPTIVLYLKSEVSIGQELMETRYHGDENKKDIHEKDIEYLKRCKLAADYCSEKHSWEIVNCLVNGEMRSIEDIHRDVVRHLKNTGIISVERKLS